MHKFYFQSQLHLRNLKRWNYEAVENLHIYFLLTDGSFIYPKTGKGNKLKI
jgi:hypothetical protein